MARAEDCTELGQNMKFLEGPQGRRLHHYRGKSVTVHHFPPGPDNYETDAAEKYCTFPGRRCFALDSKRNKNILRVSLSHMSLTDVDPKKTKKHYLQKELGVGGYLHVHIHLLL